MKIIEAFPFFNEINMLTYRLNVLNDVVDLFVIVEGTMTFTGKDKPLYFKENEHLFEKFKHKIVHYVDRDMPFPNANPEKLEQWENDWHQRNSIQVPLAELNLEDDDVIAITDLDEIVDPNLYREIRNGGVRIHGTYKLNQPTYYYNLNTRHNVDFVSAYITTKKALAEDRQRFRLTICGVRNEYVAFPVIWNAGWHMSFFGDASFVQNKLLSYAHMEYAIPENTNLDIIKTRINTYKEPFVRELPEHSHFGVHYVDVKDNKNLPPFYTTHLRSFYTSIAVVVNSCIGFYKTTLPFVVKSAQEAKIPLQNLYIVIGECDEERIDSSNGYTLIFTRYVNLDYNGVVYFTQDPHGLETLKQYTHFFYTQDTATFMPHFWDTIQKYTKECSSYIKILEYSSKSIGLFSVDWFIENKKEFYSYVANTDKSLKWNYKSSENFPREELIRSKFTNLYRWLNEDSVFSFSNGHPIGPVFENNDPVDYSNIVKIYSDEDRLAVPFKNPGIIKYQINWGQPGMVWKMVL